MEILFLDKMVSGICFKILRERIEKGKDKDKMRLVLNTC